TIFNAYSLPYEEALDEAVRQVKFGYVGLVVCEDFVISERTIKTSTAGWRRGMELEFIGVVRYWCRVRSVEFVLQDAGDAKRFATDEKLKAGGLWTPGVDHPRDATRHLLLALVNRRLIDPRVLLT